MSEASPPGPPGPPPPRKASRKPASPADGAGSDTPRDGLPAFGDTPVDGPPTFDDPDEVPLAGPSPDHASAYVPPRDIPKPADHKTIDISPIRISPDADPRRALTQKAMHVIKREEAQRHLLLMGVDATAATLDARPPQASESGGDSAGRGPRWPVHRGSHRGARARGGRLRCIQDGESRGRGDRSASVDDASNASNASDASDARDCSPIGHAHAHDRDRSRDGRRASGAAFIGAFTFRGTDPIDHRSQEAADRSHAEADQRVATALTSIGGEQPAGRNRLPQQSRDKPAPEPALA